MKAWGFAAVLLLAIWVAGCGGNSTVVGITIAGQTLAPETIVVNHPAQFVVNVTGVSTSTVFWQICETPAVLSTTIPPAVCTAGQGPQGCTIQNPAKPITGFGTITVNGLYTAPPTVPNPSALLIVATSCIKSNAFATFAIQIDSGIAVQIFPGSATVGLGDTFQFTDLVTGTNDTGVVWLVNGSPGGEATDGFICPSNVAGNPCTQSTPAGEYFAPTAAPTGSVTVAAQSGADPTKAGTATVTLGSGDGPAFGADPVEPMVAAQGAVQQDVYLAGSGFLSTTRVLVNNVAIPTANVTLISTTLIRATIPGAQLTQAGSIMISLQSQDGTKSSGTQLLPVVPVRPVIIASTPDSVQDNNGNASLTATLTGGYFVPNSTAKFNGIGCGGGGQVCTTYVDSRHLNVSIQDGSLGSPGLYQLVVQNPDAVTAGVPSLTGLNLAVNPNPPTISTGPALNIPVGLGPSAAAIDEADGIAVVANTAGGSVSLVSMVSNSIIGSAITVGTAPTGVAVDDMLPHHMAYVVNSGSNSVSVIDLSLATPAVVGTLSLASYIPSIIPTGTVPFSIGANPLTHRAFIANQSTNVGTILDLANPVGTCGTPPCPVAVVTGGITPFGTGTSPQVAIDPRLNWAMVTPGGAGTTSMVDLGRAPSTGDVGRLPELIGSLSISSTVQGVGINTETHQALLADPSASTLTTFSLLDNTVTSVRFTLAGALLPTPSLASAAVTPLENIGIAVTDSPTNATGVVADLSSGVILQQISGLKNQPEVVVVDPASNQAIIVNEGSNSVSILSLGPTLTPPQILEASPATTLTSSTTPVKLTITGANFTSGSMIRLDQTALSTTVVPITCVVGCRQLTAMVPTSMLGEARRFLVDVQNSPTSFSNVTDLAVIQAVPVGTTPIGVAVDTIRDLAVVTNMGNDTASLVSLAAVSATLSPESLGPVGIIGPAISTGTTPEGVAVDPLLGIAMVANNGSDNATEIDVINSFGTPVGFGTCSQCLDATGVAFDNDAALAVITNTNSNNLFSSGEISLVGVARNTSGVGPTVGATSVGNFEVDQDPVAVAVDPTLGFAAVATASSTSALDIVSLNLESIIGRVENLQNPSGVVFDPVNQVFLTVNSLVNNIYITNPSTQNSTTFSVGIAPTSIDYNYQTSSLVTVNAGSHTMSVLDYTCPPTSSPACFNPQVRAVIALGGAQTSTLVLGPNAVAIDPKLNLAVLVDPDNNRVLLVPLPH